MITDGNYSLQGKEVVVPKNVSPRDYVFNNPKGDILLNTNHCDQIAIIKQTGGLTNLNFTVVKSELRSKYKGKTVFVVSEDEQGTYKLTGELKVKKDWVVATQGDKLYFSGDSPRSEYFDDQKVCRIAQLTANKNTGELVILNILLDKGDEKFFRDIAMYAEDYELFIKGMHSYVKKGSSMIEEIYVTSAKIKKQTFEEVEKVIDKVNCVQDVMPWRDLSTSIMVPSETEARIITSALFFTAEGYAAINLFVIGPPSCGKSFLLDTYGYLMGCNVHNCAESSAKGVVYSHADKGTPGILYREKYVALMNEFVRLFTKSANAASREAEELFSAMNDAVEKKSNRKRSSGFVSDGEAKMVCSMITSDNDYKPKMAPFAKALISDPSYIRRYSILLLDKETVQRGLDAKVKVANWKFALRDSFRKQGLTPDDFFLIMKFWRSQVQVAFDTIPSVVWSKLASHANERKKKKILEIFGKSYGGGLNAGMFENDDLFLQLNEADFMQAGVACGIASAIMGSTFRCKKGLPKLTVSKKDFAVAKVMVERLVDDMFILLKPYIEIEQSQGVQRT